MTDDSPETIYGAMPEIEQDYVNYDEIMDSQDIGVLGLSLDTRNAFRRAFCCASISIRDVYKTFREVKRFPKKRWGLLPRIGPVAQKEMRKKFREVLEIELP